MWSRRCDCQTGETVATEERASFDLDGMAKYWQDLGVPDSLGRVSLHPRTDEAEDQERLPAEDFNNDLDWSAILSGSQSCPSLNFEGSAVSVPSMERTWDIDSIVSWASCLSINRGLYVSYNPSVLRNLEGSAHVFHGRVPLHVIPHLRLGSGRLSPQFGVYIFFPNISHSPRATTYLTNKERQMFVDRIVLPAIRHACPRDVIQHHPQSFEDAESKAYSSQRESCGGKVYNKMDMHHYLPHEYLASIWDYMSQKAGDPELVGFRNMFIVLSRTSSRKQNRQHCRKPGGK